VKLRHVGRRSRRGLTLADLLVVVVLIPLLLAVLVGCFQCTRGDTSNRVKCASNLRQIGQALLIYSNDARGPYPRTVYALGSVVTPTWGTGAGAPNPFKEGGPAPNDVTAALYLLLRTQDITSEVFTCPSSQQERWDFGGGANTAMNWSNWNGDAGIKKHLSYSLANPYADDGAVERKYIWTNSLGAEFALAADMNPGAGKDGTPGVLAVTSTSSARDMKAANSRNHEGDGQNVLYGDGHVEFQANPFCGVARDNIYARRKSGAGPLVSDLIVGSPYDAADSVLLPTD
jgi:prepilin-type processing-associated H-X9-DG protein